MGGRPGKGSCVVGMEVKMAGAVDGLMDEGGETGKG